MLSANQAQQRAKTKITNACNILLSFRQAPEHNAKKAEIAMRQNVAPNHENVMEHEIALSVVETHGAIAAHIWKE